MTGIPVLVRLALVGEAIHGPDWQCAMARSLGPWHPRGAREQVDDRLVRRWISGERPVPSWVAGALPQLMAAARHAYVHRVDDAARRLGYGDLTAVPARCDRV